MPSMKDLLVILIIVFGASHNYVQASEDEHRLIHYLFSEQGYNPLVRPTEHSNETVVVSFGLLLVQLIHVIVFDRSTFDRLSECSVGLRERTDHEDQYVVAYEMVGFTSPDRARPGSFV